MAVNGLYGQTTIGDELPPSNNVGSTKNSLTNAAVLGTEPANGARSSAYADASIIFGEKKYFEWQPVNFAGTGANFWWFGLEVLTLENPNTDTGQFIDELGFARLGGRYISGSFSSGGFSYGQLDVIGFAVDYTDANNLTVDVYRNNALQQTVNYAITNGIAFRPASTLGLSGNVGSEANLFTAATNLNFSPPSGFEPLEAPDFATVASFTLTSDGRAIRSDTGEIINEWWTNQPQENIGNFYQVKAELTDINIAANASFSGIFGSAVLLNTDRVWSVSSFSQGDGIRFNIQIIDTFSLEVVDTAMIQIGVI